MSIYKGKRIAVIGIARAGTAMALSLARAGAEVIALDQKPADDMKMLANMDRLAGEDIEVVTSWDGTLDFGPLDVLAPSPGVPPSHPAVKQAILGRIPVHSEIEIAYRLTNLPIIAVTGTNGKSTVAALTHHILETSGRRSTLCGNVAGTGLNEQQITSAATRAREGVLTAEISSFQLEWIQAFRPKACTITNIVPDHLDRYTSFEEYANAKKRIYENQRADDFIIINASRPETHPKSSEARRLIYGKDDADMVVSDGSISADGEVLSADELWAGGLHNIENSAAASLLCAPFDVSATEAFAAIRSFRGIANRMEIVADANGIKFINNSMCTNPDALRASVLAAKPPVLLLAGGVAKVDDWTPLRQLPPGYVRRAFLFGRDAARIQAAFREATIDCALHDDMAAAFSAAVNSASGGETIMLSPGCASFDQFEDFIERGEAFRVLVHDFVGQVPA